MKRGRKFYSCLLLMIIIIVINTINVFTLIRTRDEDKETIEETVSVGNTEPEETIQSETIPTTCPEEEKIVLTESEFKDFCRIGYPEWRGESMEGQIAGFATVLNRMKSDEFKDDLYEVLYQPGQFSTVRNKEIYKDMTFSEIVEYNDLSERTITAAQRALDGEDPTEELLRKEAERLGLDPEKYAEGGALYFYNPDHCGEKALESRAYIKVKIRIGNHIFYKFWDKLLED